MRLREILGSSVGGGFSYFPSSGRLVLPAGDCAGVPLRVLRKVRMIRQRRANWTKRRSALLNIMYG